MRAMTFNICHGAGVDHHVDLSRTLRVIRDARVDVAGLQEVDRHYGPRSGFVDQAGWLARELGMDVAFGATIDDDPPAPGRPRRQYGNAVLAVAPILRSTNVLLPRTDGHEQRGLLCADIDIRGVRWQVCVTHLQHDDPAERLAQARAVIDTIGTPVRPTALLGDLNATPDTPEIRLLATAYTDAWAAAGGLLGSTFANPVPHRRIDYVMLAGDASAGAVAVARSLRARLASDHLPVTADLTTVVSDR
jgi:endonuclease/exonuclease/phosphatase family metal-dependent hydrolase